MDKNWQEARRWGAVLGSVFLLACVLRFSWNTRHWPLVNDPALMSYVVFLMGKGLAPYREIGDINLPGAYVPEWVSLTLAHGLHVSEAAMWRAMDLAAMLGTALGMAWIAGRGRWFAAVWAGSLFALFHGRDGVGQAGQRDLWVAMLLIWVVGFAFAVLRGGRGWQAVFFGVMVGAAALVKPTGLLFFALIFFVGEGARVRLAALAAAGFGLALLAGVLFLQHWHAAGAFWRVLRVDLPYHTALGNENFPVLLLTSTPVPVAKLLLVAAATLALYRSRARLSAASATLSAAVLLGLCSFLVQGKGYPYQRYPYLAFLFLLLGLGWTTVVRSPRWPLRIAGAAGLTFGVLFCAPAFLRGAMAARWMTPVQSMEEAIAAQHPGPGEVQCLDVATGCTDALLHLHLRPATGTMYDEYLFPQTPSPWGVPYYGPAPDAPLPQAVADGRERFRLAILQQPPRVFIVTRWLFPQGPGDYRKLALWPWCDNWLGRQYTLVAEHDYPRAENGPMGFRVYVRR